MRERHSKGRRRLRLMLVGSSSRRHRRAVSLGEQVRAAAERYEADIRAAGARYDAALNRIIGRLPESVADDDQSAALDGETTLMARPTANPVVSENPVVVGYDQDEEQ